MFLDFYQMQSEPFGVTPDPRFLYLGKSPREALASLFYGIESDRGFMVLIAPPGSGKTTLVNQLVDKIQPSARTVFLFQTQCNSREMMQYLLNDLGVDVTGMETVTMHNKLNQILAQERAAGRRFVLIVDEAHNLDPGVLETIRLLSNFETSRTKLLQIVLVGQPQLARKLSSPGLEQLQQRISMVARLAPLSKEEISHYVAHRLNIAGYTGKELFNSGAMEVIASQSSGVPRNINRLCFSALSLGYAMNRKCINDEMMREVVADLELGPLERDVPLENMAAPRAMPLLSSSSPVLPRQGETVSHIKKWATGAVAAAAVFVLILVLTLLSQSHRGYGSPAKLQGSAGAREVSPGQTASPTTVHAAAISNALPQSGTPVVSGMLPTAHSPNYAAAIDASPEKLPPTVRVTVHRGETLGDIALRTLGQSDKKLLREIQQLNPRITDPDHILVDQKIRLPLISKANDPFVAAGATEFAKKNQTRTP